LFILTAIFYDTIKKLLVLIILAECKVMSLHKVRYRLMHIA
jgi:hypothetical protein